MASDEPNVADNDVAVETESSNSLGESCSICLELVAEVGRSCVKLVCGHEFHLDCIGSSFNSRGKMQCPNCRNTENGEWLYGSAIPPTETSDEEFPEMSLEDDERYHQLFLSREDGEVPRSPYRDLMAQFGILAEEPAAVSSTIQLPPNFSIYAGLAHPNIPDHLYNNHWSTRVLGLNEAAPTSSGFQPVNPYSTWDHYSSSPLRAVGNLLGNENQLSPPSMIQRSNTSMTRPSSVIHPFAAAHSSSRRGVPNSFQIDEREPDYDLFGYATSQER